MQNSKFSSTVASIFEDESILVLDKPAGLIVTKADTAREQTLEDILINDFKINLDRAGIVHRLDKDTSGVIVVAKTEEALADLQKQFKDRVVKKEYLALVHGTINSPGNINAPIDRNPKNREKFTVIAGGREAETNYEPVQRLAFSEKRLVEIFSDYSKIQFKKLYARHYTNYTLIKCFPQTGRTHQIRVHLKYINHPIVGDEKYVGKKLSRLDQRWCKRHFLHAARIEFNHPETGKRVAFESKLPEDLEEALGILKPAD